MRTAYKFLSAGAVSPFTRFRWPKEGEWVFAREDREEEWVFACRPGDLPYWLEEELWLVELSEPVREARYQISAPGARLLSRIHRFDAQLRREFATACARRARELALPALPGDLSDRIARAHSLSEAAAAARAAPPSSLIAGYLGDALACAAEDVAATSYITCILAAARGGGEASFEAERAWQARWLSERLSLEAQ